MWTQTPPGTNPSPDASGVNRHRRILDALRLPLLPGGGFALAMLRAGQIHPHYQARVPELAGPFAEAVLRERAILALEDPGGERDAVTPLSQARAWTILLDLDHRPPAPTPLVRAGHEHLDQRDLLVAIGADLTRTKGMVRCPAHEDRGPSLSWRWDGDRALVKCFAGCTFDAIRAAVTR